MIALIDGDLVAYRCSASAENDGVEIAVTRCDRLMQDILAVTTADSYRVFLTGGNNFRKDIDPEYKANRKDTIPPQYLQQCREHLVVNWKAEVCDGHEADDALGVAQVSAWHIPVEEAVEETIICSLDKDLLQIPGKHYRWQIGTSKWTKEAELLNVDYLAGLRSFYISSLVGDKSDNVRGVDGIGKVRADKALIGAETEQEMFDTCRILYNDDERYFRNVKLLWIWREENDIFDPVKRGLIELDTSTDS